MNWSKKWFVVGALALSLSACAFKEDGKEGESGGSALVPEAGDLRGIQLSWEDQSEPLKIEAAAFIRRDTRVWVREEPVTIPALAPERIRVEMALAVDPQSLGDVRALAVSVTSDGGYTRAVGVSDPRIESTDGVSKVWAELSGLPVFFSKEKEQKLYVRLTIEGGSGYKAELRLALATPPSRLALSRFETRQDLEQNRSAEGKLPPVLVAPAQRLTLMERAVYRNDSGNPVRLEIPFKVQAQIKRPWTDHLVVPAEPLNKYVPRFQSDIQRGETVASTEVYVVPYMANVESNWTSTSQESVRNRVLQPGESLELGLYVTEDLEDFRKLNPAAQPVAVNAQIGGAATCPQGLTPLPGSSNGDEGVGHCSRMQASHQHSGDAVENCKRSILALRSCMNAGMGSGPCNEAATIDMILDDQRTPHPDNGIPWPIFFGCRRLQTNSEGRLAYIHYGWVWEPVYASYWSGRQTHAAYIEPLEDDGQILGQLRYVTGNASTERFTRPLQIFGPQVQVGE